MTKSQLRTEVRQKLGDKIRLSGTATGGSTFTLTATELQQPDSHWDEMQLIITAAGGAAPENESRKIAKSTFTDTTVRVELPFSAVVESGDSWAIAVFDDTKYDAVIRKTLKEFSWLAPLQFSEDLAVTADEKRFTPTSATDIISVQKIEFVDVPTKDHIIYTDWWWDNDAQEIEFKNWQPASKTLTLHGGKFHTFPSAEDDNHTVLDRDLDNFIDLCAVEMLLDMTEQDFYDNIGNLNPDIITQKDITKEYRSTREFLLEYAKQTRERIESTYAG